MSDFPATARPRPPAFQDPADAPWAVRDRDVSAAVERAARWEGIADPDVDALGAVVRRMARDGVDHQRVGLDEAGRRVVQVACRHVYQMGRIERIRGTAGAFPFVELRCIRSNVTHPCAAAEALDRRILPVPQLPELPLDGCDAARCDCSIRQLNRG